MHTDRWSALSPLLDELLELEGGARELRLDEIALADKALAEELRNMMTLDDQRPDFLAQPVVDAAVFSPQPGQEIGPYRLEVPIGEGGMGQVWQAVRADGLYDRRVALKLLRPGLGDAGLRQRFTLERQILARLAHAHIARLLDAGISQDGQPYLALEFVRGEAITDYARKLGLDLQARLALFAQVCAAVSHAHANLVVHRDLKPSNILVTPAGDVRLLDFGIAKLLDERAQGAGEITRTGARTFTLHYAAPEQVRGEPVTTMTDVYALGMVLYELLTGRKPYELARPSDAAWEEAIVSVEPVRPSQAAARTARDSELPADLRLARQLRGDLDNIILKALHKQPDERYASVEALAQDLQRHLDGQPVQARPQSWSYRTGKYLRRHALGLSLAIGVSGLLAAGMGVVWWQAHKAIAEAERAQAMQDFVIALFENTDRSDSSQSLDVHALLDAGVRRADTELATQPQARAELLGLIVRLRQGLGDDRDALGLLDKQSGVLDTLGEAAPPRLRLEAAAMRGRSLRALGQSGSCVNRLAPTLPLAQAQSAAWPLVSAEFLSQLGRCHRELGGLKVAGDLFGEALRLRQSAPDSNALQAESEADLARLLADQGQLQAAIPAMRLALDRLRASGGERNALGVEIWRALGDLQRRSGNVREAEAGYRQALDIALTRFGASHPASAEVELALGELLLSTGALSESERLLRLARDSLQPRLGDEHESIARLDQQIGQAALIRGDGAEAEASLQSALTAWRKLGQGRGVARTQCLLARNFRLQALWPEAERAAAECRQGLSNAAAARSEQIRALSLQVDIALAQGQAAKARELSERATTLRQGELDEHSRRDLGLIQARLLIAEGRDPQATTLLQSLPAATGRAAVERDGDGWRGALLAELQCRNGEHAAGQQALAKVRSEVARTWPEAPVLLLEIDALAPSCKR